MFRRVCVGLATVSIVLVAAPPGAAHAAGRLSAAIPNNVFVCQASGSVGPIVGAGDSSGIQYYGNAQGTGTCQSSQGSWTVTYTGQWEATVNTSTVSPPPNDGYAVSLTLTNTATGQVVQRDQIWQELDASPLIRVDSGIDSADAGLVPDGAGIVYETPATRAFTDPFTTTTNWFFGLTD